MKTTALFVIAMAAILFSCSENDSAEWVSETDGVTTVNEIGQNETEDLGEIIPIPESNLKRSKNLTRAMNVNDSFWDLRELDVNIVCKEGSGELRYLQSQGTGQECVLARGNNNANQKFKLYFAPLTGWIYIKNNQGKLLSLGVYSNAPDTRVLYVKDDTSTTGAIWDFLKGEQRDHSVILQNADAISQGPSGSMWDIYYDCIGSNGSKVKFGKYNSSATQEWEIRLVEPCSMIGSPQYFIDEASWEEKPSYVLRGTVYNANSTTANLTVQYTQGAKNTSNFSESNSYSTQMSMNMGIKTPFFDAGVNMVSTTTNGFSYGTSDELNVSWMYNLNVAVEPYKSVRVLAVVKNYNVNCRYKATLEGTSGRRIYLEGTWDGISCADVDYTIEVLNRSGVVERTKKLHNPLSRAIDMTR